MSLLKQEQKVGDTYLVERYLGEGAFAEVYRVQHRFLGRQAMKVFKDARMTADEIEEMLQEAIMLSRIGHPNIVRVFDANILKTPDTTLGFFTMEYVPGGTLEHYWQSHGSKFMPVADVIGVMKQVCSGIAVAHSESPPVVHRDIKPANILIGYDGNGIRVRVSDFGLAKRVNPLTLLASSRGTLSFKPPESFKNMDSCAADVWAMGTTMYLLLTDVLPHPSLDERDVYESARFLRPLRPPSVYNIQVDPPLDAIVARCLATKADERYPDASALLADLARWEPKPFNALREKDASTKTAKTALGALSSHGQTPAPLAVKRAIQLARDPAKLVTAADLLEEAINKDPSLKERYESQLMLWRRGVHM